ncbi:hypothetical protein AB0M02_39210 [Actinoplanes sp. NPDC051861]|uniref:hypothetical protein n=1 Tax=Actinoplanes sp. NPDC051861 TaxID=3155170 RepID=UPI0034336E1A
MNGEVVAALEGIRSWRARRRREAYDELVDLLVMQGTRAPEAIPAAGGLIEVVADTGQADRSAACQVLSMIAIGDEEYWLTEAVDIGALRAEVARQAGLSVEDLEREQEAWVEAAGDEEERAAREHRALFADVEEDREQLAVDLAAYDAVRAGVPVYLEALTGPETAVRLYAAHLLSWFPEESARIVPALTRVIAGDPDPIVAATACVAAALCAPRRGEPDRALVAALATRLDSENLAERWSALIGSAIAGAPVDTEELARCRDEAAGRVPHWPFLDGDIGAMAGLAYDAVISRQSDSSRSSSVTSAGDSP